MLDWIDNLWRGASPLKKLLIAGVPAVIVAAASIGVIYAFAGGGSSTSAKQQVLSATEPPATSTPVPPTATPVPPTPEPTATPQPSTGDYSAQPSDSGAYTGEDTSSDPEPYVAPRYLSGPGPEQGTDWSMAIPAIGVSQPINSRTIGENGQMGDPTGPWDIVWYDFTGWDGLGGAPGEPGANAVFAGHVDYIRVGPAVFYGIGDLQPGDIVTVWANGQQINYSIQWTRWAEPDEDFTGFVARTGQDSVTLVTCVGSFSGGHYSNRLIARGVRV
jgi:LPXTG-site transpeptidase (sortase) family protein